MVWIFGSSRSGSTWLLIRGDFGRRLPGLRRRSHSADPLALGGLGLSEPRRAPRLRDEGSRRPLERLSVAEREAMHEVLGEALREFGYQVPDPAPVG
jgi:hypothetical protein